MQLNKKFSLSPYPVAKCFRVHPTPSFARFCETRISSMGTSANKPVSMFGIPTSLLSIIKSSAHVPTIVHL